MGLTDAECHELRAAHDRDAWAGEWNSLPTAVDRIIAKAKAEAWDEGYKSGVNDEATSQDWTDGQVSPARINPFRAALDRPNDDGEVDAQG